ncbi:MAG: response regulator transcription factor [Lachnospiraceae bacterium]|nr:response regulator transcription factor [Lachnospiraceae bacterium]
MSIELMIIDDHSMVREGLKQLLELDEELKVVSEASDGIEGLQKLETVKPDVLLLDINLPNMNGLEMLKIMRERKIDTKVLILTIHNEIDYLMKAVEIGCNGYVLKDSDSNLLKKAIYAIHSGEDFIQPSLTPALNAGLAGRASMDEKVNDLTRREVEVLKLIAEGLFNKEIAAKLDISERTVKNHVSNIFKKIDVSDRTQAAVFAIKNNLVNL